MPNDALRQAKQDVPADSSPATTDDAAQSDPAPGAGETPGDKGTGKGGRSIDEVRGELTRKLEEMSGRFSRLEEMLQGVTAGTPRRDTEPAKDLNDMTTGELEALRPHIPEDKKAAFEVLVNTRREEERVDARFERKLTQRETVQARKAANEEAYDRYPELSNEVGTFYREVNKVLDQWGDPVTKNNPYAVLQAANEAAHRLGIKPRERVESRSGRVSSRTAPASDNAVGTRKMSVEQSESIARGLTAALPAGKTFSKDVMEGIRKRADEYEQHRDLFIRK